MSKIVSSPSVSVCVATFNGALYLEDQLRSILASPKVDEVIVTDDGSVDGTKDIIININDPRLTCIEGPRLGLIRNFEHALQICSGDIIFLSDQDDLWLPQKVDRMLEALVNADLVVSDCIVVDEKLRTLKPSFFKLRSSGPGLLKNLYKCTYLGCCIGFKKHVLKMALPFPKNLPMHDWWLGLIAELAGDVSFIDDKLVLYRRHGKNVSSSSEDSNNGFTKRILWRLVIIKSLLFRLICQFPRFYFNKKHFFS